MLFRSSSHCFGALIVSFAMLNHLIAVELPYEDAKNFANSQNTLALDSLSTTTLEEITPEGDFDPKTARTNLSEKNIEKGGIGEFLKDPKVAKNIANNSIHPNELIFRENSDALMEEGVEYQVKKCRISGEGRLIQIERERQIELIDIPEESILLKICKGHSDSVNGDRSTESALVKGFENDPEIKSYKIRRERLKHRRYRYFREWTHKEDCKKCDHSVMTKKILKKREYREKDFWQYSDGFEGSFLESPDVTLIKIIPLEGESVKLFNGVEVKRSVWKERVELFYQPERIDECSFLKSLYCEEIGKKCLKELLGSCVLWEKTYKCANTIGEKRDFHLDIEAIKIHESTKNSSFSSVTATLQAFSEIEKDLKRSNSDPYDVRIFKGRKFECTKNIAGDLVYDCCFSMKGLANDAHLHKCNAKELALSEMRERGMSHYVGNRLNKTLSLKTSNTHVYCCFDSKIARIFQEEARKQLGISWGDAENPNLEGLTMDQIKSLDFKALDLSELFEEQMEKLTVDIVDEMKRFQDKLSDLDISEGI